MAHQLAFQGVRSVRQHSNWHSGCCIWELVGALAIGWVFPRLGIHLGIGIARPLIDATIGAVIGAWIFSAIRRQALGKSTP